MKFPQSEFWDYSIQIYQLADVADTCLKLQNTCGADVNLLLFCCWLGNKGLLLTADDINNLQNVSLPWQSAVLKPLREARHVMKNQIIAMPAELHNKTINNLTEMEINAEHMEQINLEKSFDFSCHQNHIDIPPIEVTARNLMLYAQQLPLSVECTQLITCMLHAVFGDAEAAQAAMMTATA